jgi:hypothetical protein
MNKKLTEADFKNASWHDCSIWGISCRVGDGRANDWTSDVVFDIDFITNWKCESNRKCQFLVAPASLVFHNVTDLRINIDWGDSKFRTSLHRISVDRIERERIKDQKIYLDRPYYKWKICLNWPEAGEISFGAAGFTQSLLAKPVKRKDQNLSLTDRDRLTDAAAVRQRERQQRV